MVRVLTKFIRTSMFTKKIQTRWISVDPAGYLAYAELGVDIQRAMPYLEPWEREFIMTGVTREEWDEHMKPMEDDDEDGPGTTPDAGDRGQ